METTQKITHWVYWIVVALVGNALSWLVSAFTPVPQGAVIILALGFAAWADLDYGLYGTEEDMRKRGFLIYGLATFFAFYLAFGRSGVQVASLEIPILTLTLLETYAVAWLVDHILPATFGVPDVTLDLDGSTAFGSWIIFTGLVVGVGGMFLVDNLGWNASWTIAWMWVAALMVDGTRIHIAELRGFTGPDDSDRSEVIYLVFTAIAIGGHVMLHLPILTMLVVCYGMATLVEVFIELMTNREEIFVPAPALTAARS